MNKIAIIIPSRLNAKRFPDKPLKLIKKREMILHVYDTAIKSQAGEVIVATPDEKIIEIIEKNGGKAVMTKKEHETGTDRIFEVFDSSLKRKAEIIINLQGDMPNLDPMAITNLVDHMKKEKCDIGTLASQLKKEDLEDENVCKVVVREDLTKNNFSSALDFYRRSNLKNLDKNFIYHHIGIYGFTNESLVRYVSLKRSNLEIKRKLEQMRALENNMKINVAYIDNSPLSVDTEEDLNKIIKIMEK
jgi:3-deoxy-manno-octulosonate cytidylyltransferase (CMP-KDO synthetase)